MDVAAPQVKGFLHLPFQKAPAKGTRAGSVKSNRIPLLGFLKGPARGHFVAGCGEFVGTFLFLFFALAATQVANATTSDAVTSTTVATGADTSRLLYISLAFGFSLAVNAWVFFRISGGLFNPAVTLGMALVGAITWFRALLLFLAQIMGALSAGGIVYLIFPGELNVQTTLGGGCNIAQGLFMEMFLTAELVFTIFMLAAEKHKATFIAPIGIGLSLFIAEMCGVYFTGGSLNPARSFAPAVVNHNFHGYHWIYWVGPGLGAILAATFYKFIKMLEYETANPQADMDDRESKSFNPDNDQSQPRVSFDPAGYKHTPAEHSLHGGAFVPVTSNGSESDTLDANMERGSKVPSKGLTGHSALKGSRKANAMSPTTTNNSGVMNGAATTNGETVPAAEQAFVRGPDAEAGGFEYEKERV